MQEGQVIEVNPLPLQDILKIIKGTVIAGRGNPLINHIATEKFQMRDKKTTLFFHLNSNEQPIYVNKYKTIIVTEKPAMFKTTNSSFIIKVENIHTAYWSTICYYRELFTIPVFGITGTSGKTTTKEMISQILAMKGLNVESTYKSFNSDRRNLLYLVEMNNKTDAGVYEMGVSDPGDLKKACKTLQPNIRVLLNIGVYHLEGCITMENYIKAKAEILEGIKPEDILILNSDDKNSKKIDVSHIKQKIYIGIYEEADFMAKNIEATDHEIRFTLVHNSAEYQAVIPVAGKHNVYNALASIAAVYQIGIGIEESIKLLSRFKHLHSHLQRFSGKMEV